MPYDRNDILVRFENIADLFDYVNLTLNDTTVYVDVMAFAQELFD